MDVNVDQEIEALRTVLEVMEKFDRKVQDRILEYVRDKLESERIKSSVATEEEG